MPWVQRCSLIFLFFFLPFSTPLIDLFLFSPLLQLIISLHGTHTLLHPSHYKERFDYLHFRLRVHLSGQFQKGIIFIQICVRCCLALVIQNFSQKIFALILSKPTILNNYRNLNCDGITNKKEIGLKIEIWSRHHNLFWKTMKNHKDKLKSTKIRSRVQESVTRGKGISTLQRPSKGDTFNWMCRNDVFILNTYFSHK